MLITTGRITNHISITVFKPDFQNSLIPDEFTKEVSENTRLEKLPEGKTALGYGFEEATIVVTFR
jgi:hypothetical protein